MSRGPLLADVDDLVDLDEEEAHQLGLRAGNLGVVVWDIWESGLVGGSLVDEMTSDRWWCPVVDLGSLRTEEEQGVVANAVLATGQAIRIAAEGRKFGLHLLISTQRPQKVHENVPFQCDNLIHFGHRITEEGGSDIEKDRATRS
jgi:hypothetical protein